jgi:hypothetical protein
MSLHLTPIRRAAGAVALLALSAAAPAAAAPIPIYGGHTSQDAPIALRTSADGRSLTQLLVHVDLQCADGSTASWSGAATFAAFKPPTIAGGKNVFSPARVSRGGSFRDTGEARDFYDENGIGTITETLRGAIRHGVAHGTYSATLDIVDGQSGQTTASCHSGTLRWAARTAPGRVYAGRTSDDGPVVIERSRDGRRVDSVWMSWSADCQSGGSFDIGDDFVHFPVSRAGRFGNAFDQPFTLDGGATRTFAYQLGGQVGASRASGTFRVIVTDKEAAGATTDSCDSTQLRWTASSTKGKPPNPGRTAIRRVGA